MHGNILLLLSLSFLLFVKRVPLHIALDTLLTLEEELDALKERGGDGGRGLPKENLRWIRQVDAHDTVPAGGVRATLAIRTIHKAIWKGKGNNGLNWFNNYKMTSLLAFGFHRRDEFEHIANC